MLPRSEWDYALGPPFLAMNERIHASLLLENWCPAQVVSVKSMMLPILEPWKLAKRPIPPLPEIPTDMNSAVCSKGCIDKSTWETFVRGVPVSIPAERTVVVELEAIELTTGFLRLEFDSSSTTKIRVMCSESYETPMARGGPGAKRQKNDRTDHINGKLYGPSDFYTSKPGKNVFEPFWFRAFRYIQLEVSTSNAPATLLSFQYRKTQYPLDIGTTIQASPELENMWQISLNTLKNCMHETYEDCPFYEQNQFIMDSRLQMLFTYQISTDDRLARKTMQEFYASRREDGLLEAQFPNSGRCVNIPQFSLFWILMIHDHMMYFGDQKLVRRYLGTVDGILDHFDVRLNEISLVGQFEEEMWPFVDWVAEWHGNTGLHSMGIPRAYWSGAATYNSLIYAFVLQHAADLCDFVHRPDTASEYRRRSRSIIEAVNAHCFDGELYSDGPDSQDRSQHPQIFAVLSGAIQGEAAANLMRRTILDSLLPRCSYALSFYLLRAAAQAGVYEELFPYLVAPWRKMMSQNLTTWAEDDVMFRSDCHGWSASPINEIVSKIFGLSPASAAYRSLKIEPAFSILPPHAEGDFVTKDGKISLSWDEASGLQVISDYDVQAEVVGQKELRTFHLKRGVPSIVYNPVHWSDQGDQEGATSKPETSSHRAAELMTVKC
jgi:alpha-L-rhamnosidase